MKTTLVPDYLWKANNICVPIPEHKFHPIRRWRFDFAFLEVFLAIEIEGGIFTNGRHTRGPGFLADMEKYNAATELGWSILRYSPTKIDFDQIKKVYNNLKENKERFKENCGGKIPCD